MQGYYDYGATHRLSRHLCLVSLLNSWSRAVGARLSALTGTGLAILEESIEHREGRSVGELVRYEGIPRFREMESKELGLAVSSSPPGILVLGEGALSHPGSRTLVERRAHLVHLRPSRREMRRELEAGGARNVTFLLEAASIPGSEPQERIDALIGIRESEYRGATVVFDLHEEPTHLLVADLVERLLRVGMLRAA